MLLFVFFIATLNLGVGYALGAKLTLADVMAMIPRRKKGEVDLGEDSAAEAGLTAKPEAVNNAATEALPPSDPTQQTETASPPPAAARPQTGDVMAGLALFREQLAEAGSELQKSQEDPEQFVENASKLQEANHAYLEKADSAIQQLNELGEAGDTAAAATCSVVTRGAEKVAELSGEIDGMIDAGLDSAEARKGLVSKAQATSKAADDCQAEADQAASGPTPTPTPSQDPPAETITGSFATVDELFEQLEEALGVGEEETTEHVAAIRIDPIAGHEDNDELTTLVEGRLLQLAQDVLSEEQTLTRGKPAMALLRGDDFEAAIERMEAIRKQLESTTFSTADGEVSATATCALADAHNGDGREKVIEQINLALDESTRSGGNRTYHHDGAFPTVVGEAAEAAVG